MSHSELGAKNQDTRCTLDGQPSVGLAIYQLPGSNAVQTAAGVRKLMAEMKQSFPQDMDYAISLDQTSAVTEGMKEIIVTLLIAIVLYLITVGYGLTIQRTSLHRLIELTSPPPPPGTPPGPPPPELVAVAQRVRRGGMLLGTYENPPQWEGRCGFLPEDEERLGAMLGFRDVHGDRESA